MWSMLWPILVVVGANTFYNISAKSTPNQINSFASLALTYLVAMLCSVGMFFVTAEQKNLLLELAKTNWATYILGLAIVGLEFGFICVYRAGWKIGVANLFASIALACVLLLIGVLFYKEMLTIRQYLGIGACVIGLILIMK